MHYPEDEYLSIIGSNWLHPTVKLLEGLNEFEIKKKNSVQTSPLENGYSVAIIILTVLMLESYLNRLKIAKIDEGKDLSNINIRQIFRSFFKNEEIANKLDELFVIRDTISHNHVWQANITWDKNGSLVFVSNPELIGDNIYGNKLYRKVINTKTRTSKLLKLNLFPTKIGKDDSIKVIINAYEILKFIENENKQYCYISHIRVMYNKNTIALSDFIKMLLKSQK
jgi:hypothetical protein